MAAGAHGSKAVIAALLANVGIACAKMVGFVLTGSASTLAESIHSVAGSGNQGLLLEPTVAELANAVNRVARNAPAHVGSVRIMYIEPDVTRTEAVAT